MDAQPTRVLAVANQKGGVGKTTVTVGLAEIYALHQDRRVLVVDADPQRNTTAALGVTNAEFTLNDVLYGDADDGQRIHPGSAAAAIVPTGDLWQTDGPGRIDVIASERNLAARERDSMIAREARLRTALRGVVENYDVVLIDCPPSLGMLTVNAMTASTFAVLVTEPRVASFDGVKEIARTMVEVNEAFNESLGVAGIVVNKTRKGRTDQEMWMRRMVEEYGELLIEPALPDREVFSKAHAEFRPLISFGPSARSGIAPLGRIADKIWEGSQQ
ncbi:ParA family protein (plasmid) [Citricoccus nitrophenolicus]